jgi:hypothetical protein
MPVMRHLLSVPGAVSSFWESLTAGTAAVVGALASCSGGDPSSMLASGMECGMPALE